MSQFNLLLPTSPDNLDLETLHQIGQLYDQKYPKVTGFFHNLFCCSNGNLRRHKLAQDLQNITPDMFNCKDGWLVLANVWMEAHRHVYHGSIGNVIRSGYLSGLVEKCFVSAFNFRFSHAYTSENYVPENIYNDMVHTIHDAFSYNSRWQFNNF